MDERVRHIMTGAVLSIDVHQPITEVLRLFATHTLHHLPVVDELELKGMLSSADLLRPTNWRCAARSKRQNRRPKTESMPTV